jgi:glutaredoxin
MKPLIVILAVCMLGYVANHWRQIKEQRTLFVTAEAPRLVIYGSKSYPACVRLESQLAKQGIAFQKRDLDDEATSRELAGKLARLGQPGGHIAMPVAEVDGVLIFGASFEQITKRLK